MEGVVNVEWHGQDYLHLKWHVVCSGLATPGVEYTVAYRNHKILTIKMTISKFNKTRYSVH